MKIKMRYRNEPTRRGRFGFIRVADVLHIYRARATGWSLFATVEPHGGRGQVRLANFSHEGMEVRNCLDVLKILRPLRRYL